MGDNYEFKNNVSPVKNPLINLIKNANIRQQAIRGSTNYSDTNPTVIINQLSQSLEVLKNVKSTLKNVPPQQRQAIVSHFEQKHKLTVQKVHSLLSKTASNNQQIGNLIQSVGSARLEQINGSSPVPFPVLRRLARSTPEQAYNFATG